MNRNKEIEELQKRVSELEADLKDVKNLLIK